MRMEEKYLYKSTFFQYSKIKMKFIGMKNEKKKQRFISVIAGTWKISEEWKELSFSLQNFPSKMSASSQRERA